MTESPMNSNVFPPLPGTWVPGHADGERTAFFTCPKCSTYGALAGSHEIADDGVVSPSVVCPNCDFHDHVTLVGWQP